MLSSPTLGLQLRLLAVCCCCCYFGDTQHSGSGRGGWEEGRKAKMEGRRSAGNGGSDRAHAGANDLRIRGASMFG